MRGALIFGVFAGLVLQAIEAPAQQLPTGQPVDWQKYALLLRQERDQAQAQAADLNVELQVARDAAAAEKSKATALAEWWKRYIAPPHVKPAPKP